MENQFNNQKIGTKSKWTQIQVQLRQQIIQALQKSNFIEPVPIQCAAIPLMLKNYDMAVEAQTGSGKTLAFVIPLLQKYLSMSIPFNKTFIKYLVLSPTRELCQQTYAVLKKILNNLPDKRRAQEYLSCVKCVTGGNQLKFDIEQSKKAIVLIGTVGRIKQIALNFQNWLKKVDYLYIDQADRVLKQKGINQLIRSVQKIRRTAMFSATLQGLQQKDYEFYGMRNLAKISLKSMDNAGKQKKSKDNKKCQKQISKSAYTIPGSLNNTYMVMQNRIDKIRFIFFFLQQHLQKSKTIIFLNTCASVQFYTKLFSQYFSKQSSQNKNLIFGIHGKLKNNRRARIISNFTNSQYGCLLATDVISRGIDFDRIHYIIQVDPPQDPDNYIHRIGRTARINRPGVAILMIQQHEQAFINYLANKSVGVHKIQSPSHFVPKYQKKYTQQISTLSNSIKQIIISDRDYIEKGKKAFVSFIRSYSEHNLKFIFQFKNLSIGYTAQSFFLLRIPRIKEILGKKINNFTQSQIDIESIPWRNRDQELEYQRKKQKLIKLRQQRDRNKMVATEKINIKNKKSQRKKIKDKKQKYESKKLKKDYNELRKQNKNSKNARNNQSDSSNSDFQDQDTQQIQRKLGVFDK